MKRNFEIGDEVVIDCLTKFYPELNGLYGKIVSYDDHYYSIELDEEPPMIIKTNGDVYGPHQKIVRIIYTGVR